MKRRIAILTVIAATSGCGMLPGGGDSLAGTFSHRFRLPPQQAAQCFARNAEDHSSALVARVHPTRDGAEVLVNVKNGVPYATADFKRAGGGSSAAVTLNVRTTGSRADLIDALTKGC